MSELSNEKNANRKKLSPFRRVALVTTMAAGALLAAHVHSSESTDKTERSTDKTERSASVSEATQSAEEKTDEEKLRDAAISNVFSVLHDLKKPNTGVVNHSDETSINFGNKSGVVGADGVANTGDELVISSVPDMFVRVDRSNGDISIGSVAYANGQNEEAGFYSFQAVLKPYKFKLSDPSSSYSVVVGEDNNSISTFNAIEDISSYLSTGDDFYFETASYSTPLRPSVSVLSFEEGVPENLDSEMAVDELMQVVGHLSEASTVQ